MAKDYFSGWPIDADLGYQVASAQAEDAWRRFVAQTGMQADILEADLQRAKKLFKAREAQDLGKVADVMAGRGIFFSGITPTEMGRVSSTYMQAWADLSTDAANRYMSYAAQGWDTQAALTKSIVDAALDYLNRIQTIVI